MASALTDSSVLCFLGGLVPTLFWLWFWLKEDNHPEPKYVIAGTFIVGALSTFVALPIERYVQPILPAGLILIIAWSLIEEVMKYAAIAWSTLASKNYDEPVDAMIYMITSALGFAFLENVMFLTKAFAADGMAGFWLTSNIRFIGATLLHVVSSAMVGAGIAFAFRKNMPARIFFTSLGILAATGLHTLFNFFIIKDEGQNSPAVFALLWASVIATFLLFEAVKRLQQNQPLNPQQ